MEGEWSIAEFDDLRAAYRYNRSKFDRILEDSKEYLQKLGKKKRLKMVRAILKNPNFIDTDIYYLSMLELQKSSNKSKGKRSEKTNSLAKTTLVTLPIDHTSKDEAPVLGEKKKPTKIRFTMKEKPVSDREHDDEGKGGQKKKGNKNKKMTVVSEAPNLEKVKRPMTIRFTIKE